MSVRFYGALQDVRKPSGTVHHSALTGGILVPPEAMLPARIYDQGSASSCTGFGYGKLVEVWCDARGLPCAPVSARAAYTLGRSLSLGPGDPLADFGAFPADVTEAMRAFGVLPEATVPYDEGRIDERLVFADLVDARAYLVTDIAPILEEGDARCAAIRQCLAAGIPVGFGMQVDQGYEDGPELYSGPSGAEKGGHAQRIVGYRPGAFRVANSWGLGWGDAGCIWVTDDVIGGSRCYDFYALRFAPVLP